MSAERKTMGFGCPVGGDPHHMIIDIPRGPRGKVRIVEHYGVRSTVDDLPEEIERLELGRDRWSVIAEPARLLFNERLKEKGLGTGRWLVGENRVERLLGKELLVLGWAVEHADLELVPAAVQNWAGLRPEERWWLYTVTAAASGGLEDGEVGWRKALRYALTENPVKGPPRPKKARRRRRTETPVNLPLFDI